VQVGREQLEAAMVRFRGEIDQVPPPVQVGREQLEAAMVRFRGEIDQVPPMHSALKRDGKPLYEYARQGIEVERKPRRVIIHALDLLSLDGDLAVVDVACSKGTYVRTLAADLGAMLGCGAHLAALRRTRIGGLRIEDAVTLEAFEALALEERDHRLAPPDTLLADLPVAQLTAAESERVLHGQGVRWEGSAGDRWRYYRADGTFIGLGELSIDGWLNPRRLIAVPATFS
jgi:tRNA pseudouridine55 synthase